MNEDTQAQILSSWSLSHTDSLQILPNPHHTLPSKMFLSSMSWWGHSVPKEFTWLSCDLQPVSGRPETWTLNVACEQSHDHSTTPWCLHSANVRSHVSIPPQEHQAFCPGSFINFLMRIYIFRPFPKCWFCCQEKGERTWSHWWHEESGERESPQNVPFLPPDNFTSTDEISTCKWI